MRTLELRRPLATWAGDPKGAIAPGVRRAEQGADARRSVVLVKVVGWFVSSGNITLSSGLS